MKNEKQKIMVKAQNQYLNEESWQTVNKNIVSC